MQQAQSEGRADEVLERLQWLLHYAENRSVSKTCRQFGIARTTLYRWFRRFDPADLTTLEDQPTTPPPHERASYSPAVLPAYAGVTKQTQAEKQEQKPDNHDTTLLVGRWSQLKQLCLVSLLSNALLLLILFSFGVISSDQQPAPSSELNASIRPLPLHTLTNCQEETPASGSGSSTLICTLRISHER